jgi:hypothetical protein
VITPGLIAMASAAPGFSPPGPHPLVVVLPYSNGNVGLAFVTHSRDLLRVSVPLRRAELPTAFRDQGGPLTDDHSVLALVDDRGQKRILVAEPLAKDRLRIGTTEIRLTHIVQLSASEWEMLRARIRSALKLP